jgi:hypothetical protein
MSLHLFKFQAHIYIYQQSSKISVFLFFSIFLQVEVLSVGIKVFPVAIKKSN